MILELVEADKPKSLGEKIGEYLSRPPQPILKFYGQLSRGRIAGGQHILFAVRNGLPVPLLYGICIEAKYNGFTDYMEKTDHIGPWSTDDWRLTLEAKGPAEVEIRVGLMPFEILTDQIMIAV